MDGRWAIGFATSWRAQGIRQSRPVYGSSPRRARLSEIFPPLPAPGTNASTQTSTSGSPRAFTLISKRCWTSVGQVGQSSMRSTTTRARCRSLAVTIIKGKWWAATSTEVFTPRRQLPTLSPCASGSLALFSEPGWPRALQEASQLLLRKGTGALETCFHTLLLSGGVSLKAVGVVLFLILLYRLNRPCTRWRTWRVPHARRNLEGQTDR